MAQPIINKDICILAASQKEWNTLRPVAEFLKYKCQKLHVCKNRKDAEDLSIETKHVGIVIISLGLAVKPPCPISYDRVIYVDHGVSFLKWFLRGFKANPWDFLFANEPLKRLCEMDSHKRSPQRQAGGYMRSPLLLSPPEETKEQFCQRYSLNLTRPIIVYAPTWIDGSHADFDDCIDAFSGMANVLIMQHVDGYHGNTIPNDYNTTIEALKHSDIVISDTSSVLMEAAALGRRIIQVLNVTYSVNAPNLRPYSLPRIAIIDQPFIGGWLTKPDHLKDTIDYILNDPSSYDLEFKEMLDKIGKISGATDDKSLDNLVDFINLDDSTYNGNWQKNCETGNFDVSLEEYQGWFGYPKSIRTKEVAETIVITFGTFDLFHIGHINILKRAKELGDRLIVGVSSDRFNFLKKNKYPIMSQDERVNMIRHLDFVEDTFIEHSFELKRHYIHKYQADILVMGDDWKGRMDTYNDICQVVYLERTADISTTDIIKRIRD